MDKLMLIETDKSIIAIIVIIAISFIIGFVSRFVEIQDKVLLEKIEKTITITKDNIVNDYHVANQLKLDEIEKDILTEIACLATKNNNDIKEIKNKITTGKKNERISQLVDENNKLKEENNILKEKNLALRRTNEKLYANLYTLCTISKSSSNNLYHW